jgi:hypothetical protein
VLCGLVRGDLGKAVQQLKQESGKGLLVGGVKLPRALAELGLIDEYEFVVQPRLAGHGPTLFAGAIEACRLEAREPAGVRLGGGVAASAGSSNAIRTRQGRHSLFTVNGRPHVEQRPTDSGNIFMVHPILPLAPEITNATLHPPRLPCPPFGEPG